ncbi:MAG: NAD(P)-binding domain-containing protein [Gammaproteobacteria bacterium]|nr:NAD(P)-binding domain-containing protein [Gammaproteobacteria bacterium]
MNTKIGFIGAGLMGEGMAGHLLRAGNAVSVLAHRNREPIERLRSRGAHEAADLEGLGGTSKVIFLCLPDSDSVIDVMQRLSTSLKEGAKVIDTTTSLPDTSTRISARLVERGVDFVDAPITGGPPGAESGTLTSMLGGT